MSALGISKTRVACLLASFALAFAVACAAGGAVAFADEPQDGAATAQATPASASGQAAADTQDAALIGRLLGASQLSDLVDQGQVSATDVVDFLRSVSDDPATLAQLVSSIDPGAVSALLAQRGVELPDLSGIANLIPTEIIERISNVDAASLLEELDKIDPAIIAEQLGSLDQAALAERLKGVGINYDTIVERLRAAGVNVEDFNNFLKVRGIDPANLTSAAREEAKKALDNALENAKKLAEQVQASADGAGLPEGTRYVPQEALDALSRAIQSAQDLIGNSGDARLDIETAKAIADQLQAAVDAIEAASKTAGQQTPSPSEPSESGQSSQPSPAPVAAADKTALQEAISEAENIKAVPAVSTDGTDVDREAQWITPLVSQLLAAAEASAQAVAADEAATQAQVDAAASAMRVAVAAYSSAMKPGTAPIQWIRLAGDNALGTMTKIVGDKFASSESVVLASLDGYWDALSASSLAGALHCPVLLTGQDKLSDEALAEIKRLGAKQVYVVGGPYWIGNHILDALVDQNLGVERISGQTASETAIRVADKVSNLIPEGPGNVCVVATAGTYQDALCAGPFAYARHAPIYLVEEDGTISDKTLADIKARAYERAVIVGGEYWIPASVEQALAQAGVGEVLRKAGANAYTTSTAFATWAMTQGMGLNTVAIATGESHHDALSGAAFCGDATGLLLLADTKDTTAVDTFIAMHGKQIIRGFVFGGEYYIANSVVEKCNQATS